MAVRSPASWIQGGSHSAENDRLTERAEIFAAGVVGTSDLAVAANGTPNMSVNVGAGTVYVAGSQSSTQGYYKVTNDATQNLTISAANATNPRIDLIVARVQDAQYSGSTNSATVEVVTGTAAASPVAPTAPANTYTLAQIAVAANATSITSGNITDKRGVVKRKPAVFQADAPTASPLHVRRYSSSQSAPLLSVEDENGGVLGGLDANGQVRKPWCAGWRTFAVSPGSAAWKLISPNASDSTYGLGFTAGSVSGTDRVVIAYGGKYRIHIRCGWTPNGSGVRLLQVNKNSGENPTLGTILLKGAGAGLNNTVTNEDIYEASLEVALTAGDYLNAFVLQSSGGVLNSLTGAAAGPYFSVEWIGS